MGECKVWLKGFSTGIYKRTSARIEMPTVSYTGIKMIEAQEMMRRVKKMRNDDAYNNDVTLG